MSDINLMIERLRLLKNNLSKDEIKDAYFTLFLTVLPTLIIPLFLKLYLYLNNESYSILFLVSGRGSYYRDPSNFLSASIVIFFVIIYYLTKKSLNNIISFIISSILGLILSIAVPICSGALDACSVSPKTYSNHILLFYILGIINSSIILVVISKLIKFFIKLQRIIPVSETKKRTLSKKALK